MLRVDGSAGLGPGLQYIKYSLPFSDLTAAATTQTISLQANPSAVNPTNLVIPQGAVVLYARLKHSTAFAGGALTAMTASIGKSGASNTFVLPAVNVFQAVADTTLGEVFNVASQQHTGWTPTVTFISTGANVSAATAGQVDIYIAYLNVTTSSTPGTLPGATGAGTGF